MSSFVSFVGSVCRVIGMHPTGVLKRNTAGLERGGVTFRIASTHSPQNPHKGVVWEVVWELAELGGGFVGSGLTPR